MNDIITVKDEIIGRDKSNFPQTSFKGRVLAMWARPPVDVPQLECLTSSAHTYFYWNLLTHYLGRISPQPQTMSATSFKTNPVCFLWYNQVGATGYMETRYRHNTVINNPWWIALFVNHLTICFYGLWYWAITHAKVIL